VIERRHDTQHDDIQHNDTQHNGPFSAISRNDTQHNRIKSQYAKCRYVECGDSFLLC